MAHPVPARLGERYTAAAGRRFGWTIGIALLVLAAVARWRHHPTSFAILASMGGLALAAGLLVPSALGPVERAWMKMALIISKVTTPVFMGITYFVVLMPIGVVRRLTVGSALVHRIGPEGYWSDRRDSPRSTLSRQF